MRDCRTTDEVSRCLLNFLQHYGATNLLAGMIPPPNSSRREQRSHVLLERWPAEWSHRYFSLGYLYRDPAIRLVQRGCPHFHWDEIRELCSVCPIGRRIINEAGEFRLREGITFSFPTLESGMFGFSVAAEQLELAESDRFALQFVAAYGLGCALALAGGQIDRNTVHLSRRQREAVAWASEGLTTDEIAERLNVSIHTADMHMRAVRAKLGVANTVHAVAEALRLGLIS
nr:autoinducer binding domain-containing protein [Nitratireductor luteus]